jgi:hypothetical protein
MNLRRVNPGLPADSAAIVSLISRDAKQHK